MTENSRHPRSQRKAPPTGADIAQVLGVSQSTVSIALGDNWSGRVSKATVERVRAMARTMNYVPNLAARSLRSGRGHTAYLVVPTLSNPMFGEIHAGAADRGRDSDVIAAVLTVESVEIEDCVLRSLSEASGVIACSLPTDTLLQIGQAAAGMVVVDADPSTGFPTVNVSFSAGILAAVELLRSYGHRSLLHLGGPAHSWTFSDRSHQLRIAADRARMAVTTVETDATVAGAYCASRSALTLSRTVRPTAIICDTDQIAAGVSYAASSLGISIPNDVSLVGIEDSPMAAVMYPPLTSVKIPARNLGSLAMDRALTVSGDSEGDAKSTLDTELVVRKSIAGAP